MRECGKEFDSLFNNDHATDSIFYQTQYGDSAYDDLFSLDTQMLLPVSDHIDLLGEGLSSLASDTESNNTAIVEKDKNSFKPSSNPMDLFNLEFNDCSSSNSCDSGKDSPSGSESLYDQSPWTFSNEPVNEIIVEQQDVESSSYDGFPVEFQKTSVPPNTLRQQETPQNTSQNIRPKYVYYVPQPGAEKEPFKFRTRVPPKVLSPPPKPKVFVSSNNGLQIRNYQAICPPTSAVVAPTSAPTQTSVTKSASIHSPSGSVPLPNIQIAPALVKFTQYDEVDDWQKRQEDRRIKNRAAAQASRQRKRTEVDEMKAKVAQLEAENNKLKNENFELKSQLSTFSEPQSSQTWKLPQNRKRAALAGVCMMALFMMVSVSPIDLQKSSRPSLSHARSTVPQRIINHHGKVLKYDDPIIESKKPHNETVSCAFKKPWLNKTETIRLNTDLYNWVDRHEQMDLSLKRGKRVLLRNGPKSWPASLVVERVDVTEISQPVRSVSEKKEHARQTAIRDRAWKHLDMISQSSYTLRDKRDKAKKLLKMEKEQLRERTPSKEQYEKLAASIQHRPDTLYVVTMKDYFLLPAVTRNETSRPRIALILPALSLNGTMSSQVSMMRIDLDVVGTGLFQLSREFVPLFFT